MNCWRALKIRRNTAKPICIDTEGAQIRSGLMSQRKVKFKAGSIIRIHKDEIVGNPTALSLFYTKKDILKISNEIKNASGKFIKYFPKTKTGRVIETMWANMPLPDGSILSVGYEVKKVSSKSTKNKRKSKTRPSKLKNKTK